MTYVTLKNHSDFYNALCGYIRRMALSKGDSIDIINGFENQKLYLPHLSKENLYKWLHYKANIYIMDFYNKYPHKADQETKDKIRKRMRYLYEKSIECYDEFIEKNDFENYKLEFYFPSNYTVRKLSEAIVEAGYPHQVLIFCLRTLLDSWSLEKITNELSESDLDSIFRIFINDYSEEAGIPAFMVSMYFIRMNDKLNSKIADIIYKKDHKTPLKLQMYLEWITGYTLLKYYFGKDHEHDISDWCNNIRKRTIMQLFDQLKD